MTTVPDDVKGDADGYILFVGQFEAVESTNPDDASATEVNLERLENALELADMRICSVDSVACVSGKLLIRKQYKLLQYWIARYLLDTLKQREDIKEAYEQAVSILESACSDEVCNKDPELTEAEAAELGVTLCPGVQASSKARVWNDKTLSTFRQGRLTRSGIISRRPGL